jgi:creatinine amidohydrolase/Fe(II)-dependent formamide hydrolase-like protein
MEGRCGGPAVLALTGYYRAAEDFDGMLKAQGFSTAEIGLHAGLADTALMMAVDPSLVRVDRCAAPASTMGRMACAASRRGHFCAGSARHPPHHRHFGGSAARAVADAFSLTGCSISTPRTLS